MEVVSCCTGTTLSARPMMGEYGDMERMGLEGDKIVQRWLDDYSQLIQFGARLGFQ